METSVDHTAREISSLEIVSAFGSLISCPRRNMRHANLDRLRNEEWKEIVGQRLQQVRCEYDIVCSLPLELLVHIVDYLRPEDIVRNQRVSKRWRTIFSNDAVIKRALRQTLAFLDLENTSVSVADATTYFRWQHALKYARPIKKIFLSWSSPSRVGLVCCRSGRLCQNDGGKEIKTWNFETGERSIYIEPEEEEVYNIDVSDRYIVSASFDRVITAWDMHTGERHMIVAPENPTYISIERNRVVMVPHFGRQFYPIYIWDLSADGIQEIGSFENPSLWHLDVDGNMLVVFVIDWNTHPLEVEQTKWTLTGELVDRSQFCLSLEGRLAGKASYLKLSRCYTHRTYCQQVSTSEGDAIVHITYDRAVDKLNVRWIKGAKLTDKFVFLDCCNFLTSHIAYHWSEPHKKLVIYDASDGTWTMKSYQLDIREFGARRLLSPRRPRQNPYRRITSDGSRPLICFGNRDIFGVESYDGLQLWIFNPNFVPNIPDAEPFLAWEDSG